MGGQVAGTAGTPLGETVEETVGVLFQVGVDLPGHLPGDGPAPADEDSDLLFDVGDERVAVGTRGLGRVQGGHGHPPVRNRRYPAGLSSAWSRRCSWCGAALP